MRTQDIVKKVTVNHGSMFVLTADTVHCINMKLEEMSGELDQLAYRSIKVPYTCFDMTFNELELMLSMNVMQSCEVASLFPVFPANLEMKEEDFNGLRSYLKKIGKIDTRVNTEILDEAKGLGQSEDGWTTLEFATAFEQMKREQSLGEKELCSIQNIKLTDSIIRSLKELKFIRTVQGKYLLAIGENAVELFVLERFIGPEDNEFEVEYGAPFDLGNLPHLFTCSKLWGINYSGVAMFDETIGKDDAVMVFT